MMQLRCRTKWSVGANIHTNRPADIEVQKIQEEILLHRLSRHDTSRLHSSM
jgi:hypothetical protein